MMNTHDRITMVLRQDAPPLRDPAFRLRVLERRERLRFRRRAVHTFAVMVLVAIVSGLTGLAGGEAYRAGSVVLFALALTTAAVIYLPDFGRLLRRFSI